MDDDRCDWLDRRVWSSRSCLFPVLDRCDSVTEGYSGYATFVSPLCFRTLQEDVGADAVLMNSVVGMMGFMLLLWAIVPYTPRRLE